jgi:hypothetical protein
MLNGEIFFTLTEARVLIEAWRRHYNTIRPHSSLGYRPPAPETVVSVGWQLVSVWRGCGFGCPGSGHKRLPLGQGGRAAGLVSLAVDEVAF